MVSVVTELAQYRDDAGNEIHYAGRVDSNIRIRFAGAGNRIVVDDAARIGKLVVTFDCDNGSLTIGASKGVPAFSGDIRIGQDSSVVIGRDVSCTASVSMSATEGTTITIGDDVMFASGNEIRADDGHPIFDVTTGARVNVSRSIEIGNHVWVGLRAVLLGGASVGEGTVIGLGSVVTGRLPNNCIAVGVPARVQRRDVAWERPHLSLVKPYYKPDASTVTRSRYWRRTDEPGGAPPSRPGVGVARRVARAIRRRTRA